MVMHTPIIGIMLISDPTNEITADITPITIMNAIIFPIPIVLASSNTSEKLKASDIESVLANLNVATVNNTPNNIPKIIPIIVTINIPTANPLSKGLELVPTTM